MLELAGVSAPGMRGQHGITDVTLAVREGEIVGVAGVDGNGQRALARGDRGPAHVTSGDDPRARASR